MRAFGSFTSARPASTGVSEDRASDGLGHLARDASQPHAPVQPPQALAPLSEASLAEASRDGW